MAFLQRPTFTRCTIPGQAASFALGVWISAALMARLDRVLHPGAEKAREYFPRPEYQDQLLYYVPMSLFAALLFMGWLWWRCRKRTTPGFAWPAPMAVGLLAPLLSQALARLAEALPATLGFLAWPAGFLAFFFPLVCAEICLRISRSKGGSPADMNVHKGDTPVTP